VNKERCAGPRQWDRRVGILKQYALRRELVDARAGLQVIAVARQMIGAQRIHRDQKNIRTFLSLQQRVVTFWIRETEDRENKKEANQAQFSHVNLL
jgi:hypothetical protein